MNADLKLHIAKRVPLTDQQFALMLPYFTLKTFPKRTRLTQSGQAVADCFFVVSGLLKLSYTDEAGRPHILSFAMEDWWEADFDAFFNQTQATLTLECLEDTLVYSLSWCHFNQLCDTHPQMERFFRVLTTQSYSALQRRLLSLLSVPVENRYQQFMGQWPLLLQRVTKTQVAAYLGVSRETLSRLSR